MILYMERRELLKTALGLSLVAAIDRSLGVTPTASAIDVVPVAGCISEAVREKRSKPFAHPAIFEMNRGDRVIVSGTRFVIQGRVFERTIAGIEARDDIGDYNTIRGLELDGSEDSEMTWLQKGQDLEKEMAVKAAIFMVPQGSARFMNMVTIVISQVDFRSQITSFVNSNSTLNRN